MIRSTILRSNAVRSVRLQPKVPRLMLRSMSTKPSSQTQSQTQSTSKAQVANSQTNNGNPDLGKLSFDGLGLSKNMKIFLIVVLSIFGTMETWFYCRAIYRWWYSVEEEKA